MGLTSALLRAAAARPRVLPAVAAGATDVRLAVEWELRRRRWPVARSPADASVLLVCGEPGPELAAAAERVWNQMSVPKARGRAVLPQDAPAELSHAREVLADVSQQRAAVPPQSAPTEEPSMAGRGPDRDKLPLDELHLAWGPVLTDWPAGLVLELTVQGDVVRQAQARCPDRGGPAASTYWSQPWRCAGAGQPVGCGEAARVLAARRLDSLGRLLAVAGWDAAAVTARRLRDEALAGTTLPSVSHAVSAVTGGAAGDALARTGLAPRLHRFRRRVAGSRLLRWMALDLGRSAPEAADVVYRMSRWLAQIGEAAERLADPRPLADRWDTGDLLARPPAEAPPDVVPLARMAEPVVGIELAAARLVVASFDPDLDGFPGAWER